MNSDNVFYTVAVVNGRSIGVHIFPTLVQADHFIRKTWRLYKIEPIPSELDRVIAGLADKHIDVAIDVHPLSTTVVAPL